MTTTTATPNETYTFFQLLSDHILPRGARAIGISLGSEYKTITKGQDGELYTESGHPVPFSTSLLTAAFKVIEPVKQVTFEEALNAYSTGKTIRVSYGDISRLIRKDGHGTGFHLMEGKQKIPDMAHENAILFSLGGLLESKFFILD